MHLLRIIGFLGITILLFSCKSEGPASPEEAFDSFKSAYIKSDAAEIEKLLSEKSKEKIQAIIKMISLMNDSQLKALANKFSTNADSLKSLSIKDYITIQLHTGKSIEDDLFKEIVKNKIIGIDIKDRAGVARLENGMELTFVKEGSFWKFDMEELSFRNLKK
jgi:hypothetical protein